jgi:hypothetical protein
VRIELEKLSTGWFVRCGERWEDRLTLDEALGAVASLMLTGRAPYLKNDVEHALWDLHYGYWQPQLPEHSSAEEMRR